MKIPKINWYCMKDCEPMEECDPVMENEIGSQWTYDYDESQDTIFTYWHDATKEI